MRLILPPLRPEKPFQAQNSQKNATHAAINISKLIYQKLLVI
jgi:hypothetical protein